MKIVFHRTVIDVVHMKQIVHIRGVGDKAEMAERPVGWKVVFDDLTSYLFDAPPPFKKGMIVTHTMEPKL